MKENGVKGTMIKEQKQLCSGKSKNKQGWSNAGLNLFNSWCHQVQAICTTMVDTEKQIKQQFVDKSNNNKGRTSSYNTAPNKETSTVGIKDGFFGDSLDDFVKEHDKKAKQCKKNNLDSDSDSDSSDNE